MRFLLITLKSQTWVGTWEDKNLDQQHDALFTKPWTKIRWSFAGHWQTCASLSPSILSPDAIFSPPPSLCHLLPTKWDRLLAFSLLIKLYFFDHAGSLAYKVWSGLCRPARPSCGLWRTSRSTNQMSKGCEGHCWHVKTRHVHLEGLKAGPRCRHGPI